MSKKSLRTGAKMILFLIFAGIGLYAGNLYFDDGSITQKDAVMKAENISTYSNLENRFNSIKIDVFSMNASNETLKSSPLRNKSGHIVFARIGSINVSDEMLEKSPAQNRSEFISFMGLDRPGYVYHFDLSGQFIGEFRANDIEFVHRYASDQN